MSIRPERSWHVWDLFPTGWRKVGPVWAVSAADALRAYLAPKGGPVEHVIELRVGTAVVGGDAARGRWHWCYAERAGSPERAPGQVALPGMEE